MSSATSPAQYGAFVKTFTKDNDPLEKALQNLETTASLSAKIARIAQEALRPSPLTLGKQFDFVFFRVDQNGTSSLCFTSLLPLTEETLPIHIQVGSNIRDLLSGLTSLCKPHQPQLRVEIEYSKLGSDAAEEAKRNEYPKPSEQKPNKTA